MQIQSNLNFASSERGINQIGKIHSKKNMSVVGDISFKQNSLIEKSEKPEENSKISFKAITNALGVGAWLFVVGFSIKNLKLLKPKSVEMLTNRASKFKKKALVRMEKAESKGSDGVSKVLDDTNVKGVKAKITKFFYNVGNRTQNIKMKIGNELFNNLTYAFGTLVVMPMVVLFSPIGKKNSTKEDKLFAVARQPLSVAATLGMQFTFDKLIGKHVPEVLKSNKLEDKSILDEKNKIKLEGDNYKKIKYNVASAKDSFKAFVNNSGLSKDEANELFTNKSFESDSPELFESKLKDILTSKYEKLELKFREVTHKNLKEEFKLQNEADDCTIRELTAKDAQAGKMTRELFDRLGEFSRVLNNNKMAVQKSKTMVNVLAASAIGCTFLNVIYGKTMKAVKESREKTKLEAEQLENNSKEVA